MLDFEDSQQGSLGDGMGACFPVIGSDKLDEQDAAICLSLVEATYPGGQASIDGAARLEDACRAGPYAKSGKLLWLFARDSKKTACQPAMILHMSSHDQR